MEDCMIEDDLDFGPEPEDDYDPWDEYSADDISLFLSHPEGRAEWRRG